MDKTKNTKQQSTSRSNVGSKNNVTGHHKNNKEAKIKSSPIVFLMIRANSRDKILQTISSLKTSTNMKILDKPRVILSVIADNLTEEIMKTPIKSRSKSAAIIKTEIKDIKDFLRKLKKAKVPSHVVVITAKYKKVYKKVTSVYKDLDEL